MIFIKGNCISKVFCDVFVSKKLEKEFIKSKYDEKEHIEFLSYSTKIKHSKKNANGTIGHFDHTIVIVGIFSDGTDMVIKNKNVINMGEYPYILEEATTLHCETNEDGEPILEEIEYEINQ